MFRTATGSTTASIAVRFHTRISVLRSNTTAAHQRAHNSATRTAAAARACSKPVHGAVMQGREAVTLDRSIADRRQTVTWRARARAGRLLAAGPRSTPVAAAHRRRAPAIEVL